MNRLTVAGLAFALGMSALPQQASSAPRQHGMTGAVSAPDAVTEWNATAADAALATGITPLFDPLHESRLYAIVHIAIHDALNAIDRRYEPYLLHIHVLAGASPEAAVATAAHDTLVPLLRELPPLFPSDPGVDLVEQRYTAAMGAIPDGRAKDLGVALGRAAAATVLADRADDGSDDVFLDTAYPEGTAPGEFRYVQGAPFAVAPKWGEVTPFVMRSGDQYRPPAPYDLTSKQYARDFNELKTLGGQDSTARTPDQTEIARFWFEGSPLRWNRIARTAAAVVGLDMWENARLFGLLNMALADGYIGNWDAKYFYNRWRPETAVRLADIDGNPDTTADPGWTPLWGSSGATPEYDSGHTIEGRAAAEILRRVLGTDTMTFRVCSYTLLTGTCTDPQPTLRTYTSFSQAAEENGYSRILVGWHFRNAVESGAKHGEQIGRRAVEHFMRPAR